MKTARLLIPLMAALLMGPSPAALVGHWPLDADAADVTGNGHDGAVVGASVVFGAPGASVKTGTAATFSGRGHIDVPWSEALNPGAQAPDGSGSFTLAMWARPTVVGGSHRSPFTSREDNGATVNGPIIYIEPNGQWSFWAGNNGPSGAWNPVSGGPAEANVWTHVAIVYDSETLTRKMYRDGVEVVNDPTGISANLLRNMHIGGGADDGNSFTWAGQLDDVGFWDNALTAEEIVNVLTNGVGSGLIAPDPRLRVTSPVVLPLNGGVQSFDITLTNVGTTKNLTVTGATFTGANAAQFSVLSTPATLAPAATGVLKIAFDSMGAAGDIEATLNIASNDPADPVRPVVLRGSIHDPQAVLPLTLDFGKLPLGGGPVTAILTIQNAGGTRPLSLDGVTVTGPWATRYTVTQFPTTVAAGGTGNITVVFDSMGEVGFFAAPLDISSNDAVNPVKTVVLKADVAFVDPLIAWWPLDIDARDASGNGFDGTIIEPVVFGENGANAATGQSALFEGTGRIDVMYDPRLNPGLTAPSGAGSFSVALWAYPTAVNDGNYHSPFTAREETDGKVNGPILYNTFNGRWEYWAGNNGTSGAWNPMDGGPVTADAWVHVALTYDADTTTRKMFLDGVEVASQLIGVSANSQRDLHIGAGQDDGNNFFWVGRIDDVALFRKALTSDDLQRVMTSGAGSLSAPPPPTTPFVITSVTGGPAVQKVTLVWTSGAGVSYRVQRSTTLTGWVDVGAVVPSAGATTSFTDDALPNGAAHVFYRVRVAP